VRNLDLANARTHFLQSAQVSSQIGSVSGELMARSNAASVALYQGDMASVERRLPSLRRLAELCPKDGPAAMALQRIEAILLHRQGALNEAVGPLRSVAARAQATGDYQILTLVIPELIDVLFEMGADQEAEETAEEGMLLGDQVVYLDVLVRCQLSILRSRQGNVKAAASLLGEARDRAAAPSASALDAVFLSWAEACLAAAQGSWPEAIALFEATAGVFDRAGMRAFRARVLSMWAEVYVARGEAGDREHAVALLHEARDEQVDMGATGYVAQVRSRLERLL